MAEAASAKKVINIVIPRISSLETDLISEDNDRRWAAAAKLSEYVKSAPHELWPLVIRHGSSDVDDLRQAVATCILEHVLEHHFTRYFPALKSAIDKGNKNLFDTFSSCWKFGQSETPENSKEWDGLLAAHGISKQVKRSRPARSGKAKRRSAAKPR